MDALLRQFVDRLFPPYKKIVDYGSGGYDGDNIGGDDDYIRSKERWT